MIGSMMDVTERTRQMETMVEEARFRERFIGILGHDLRNPLNAIVLSARAQKRRGPLECTPEQHRQHAQRIEASATRMGNMIADLLDLTRARLAGGIPLRKGPTDLGAVCQQVVDELSAAYPDRAVAVDVDGKAEGEWDAERLAQVLSNLVGNALEHGSPDAPVFLRCWAKGEHQVLEVQNPGSPIPEELRERLFDPFRQGEGERVQGRRNGGLGLGLFIVKEIVQAHGGTVEVTSSEKEGTTFTVRLPRPPRPKARVKAGKGRTRTA
ncbi:sensor histidine kinase [Corallococcus exercitus]|nr:sensor histidine kinase [Corallococcus exercitus]